LGFDAGCSSCSGIATRIEERVGDKLVIRNLRDPELMEWRREALGEAAPWAPILFEVEPGKIRAWVGMKMGLALSHRLGPKDTWRVMQILGELGAAPGLQDPSVLEVLPVKAQEAVVGISRGQFLRGVGGATIAASLLSGGALFPSSAFAQTTSSSGTTQQQTLARSVVRNSKQFLALKAQQEKVGAVFPFADAKITVSGNIARLSIPSPSAVDHLTGVAASFMISLSDRRVRSYRHTVFGRSDANKRFKLTSYKNGLPLSRYHTALVAETYVISENAIMSPEEFSRRLNAYMTGQTTTSRTTMTRSTTPYVDQRCYEDAVNFCERWIINAGCAGIGLVVDVATGYVKRVAGWVGKASGLSSGFGCAYFADSTGYCESSARSQCFVQPEETAVVEPRAPSYYCN
jgi:hypothetical protein